MPRTTFWVSGGTSGETGDPSNRVGISSVVWSILVLQMRGNAIIVLLKGSSLREIHTAEQILESRVGLEHIEFARAANLQKRIGVFCVGFLQPGHCQILFTKRSVLPFNAVVCSSEVSANRNGLVDGERMQSPSKANLYALTVRRSSERRPTSRPRNWRCENWSFSSLQSTASTIEL